MLAFEGVVANDTISGSFTEAAKDKTGEFRVEMVAGGQTNFQKWANNRTRNLLFAYLHIVNGGWPHLAGCHRTLRVIYNFCVL